MKIFAKLDKRSKEDYQKMQDEKWIAACRKARLSVQQQLIIGKYLDDQIREKIAESIEAIKLASFAYLREKNKYGIGRLSKYNEYVTNLINEAYGKECIDANGQVQKWDGCGIEHLKKTLESLGIKI